MSGFLHDSFVILSTAPLASIRRRLSSCVLAKSEPASGWPNALFHGEVTELGFRLFRIIEYKNGFAPVLRGRFESLPEGTKIHVSIEMTTWSILFAGIWTFLLSGFLVVAVVGIVEQRAQWYWIFHPLGMLIFGWFLVIFCFWIEAPRSRAQLRDVLADRPEYRLFEGFP